jgi:membrane associated rhomboid family serine protease
LWSSVPATLALELAMFAAGVGFYLAGTRALDRIGRYGLWALVVLLLFAYAGAAFGPPPPSVAAIAWAGIIGGVITAALAYWVDAHRRTKD